MKSNKSLLVALLSTSVFSIPAQAQTLFVPGTIGSIGGNNVGIGTSNPRVSLETTGMIDARGIISEGLGIMSLQFQSYGQSGNVGYELRREVNSGVAWG